MYYEVHKYHVLEPLLFPFIYCLSNICYIISPMYIIFFVRKNIHLYIKLKILANSFDNIALINCINIVKICFNKIA